jgi:hypothetical protein
MAKEVLELEVKSNVGEVTQDVKKLDKATDKAAGGFRGIGKAVKGVGTALKAAGIGLIIAAFVALKEALGRNQKVMNAINTVMTTVSITFNQVVDVLVDTYNWVTKSSERFNGLGKVLSGLVTVALSPLKLSFYGIKLSVEQLMLAWEKSPLGGKDKDKIESLTNSIKETKTSIQDVAKETLNAGKDIVTNFGDAIGEIGAIGEKVIGGISKVSIKANAEMAKSTVEAKNNAALAEAQIQGLIEENDLAAEKQRQIRDDETKTFAKRIEANKELGKILEKQEVEMLKLADQRVAAAKLEADANKDNIELQAAYQTALNDRAAVEAQIAGFKSEQLTNEVSLNKELQEAQNAVRAEGMTGMQRELEELRASYEEKKKMAEKSGMDTTAITKQYNKQQQDIVRENTNAQLEAFSGLAGSLSALAGDNKELAVASAIIDTYVGANKAFAQGGIAGYVTGAGIIAAGLANVQKIMETDVPGGGGSMGTTGVGSDTPAPQMMSGAFDLTGAQAPEAVRAFVVTDEMTNSQDQLANIRRRATI